MNAFVIEGKSPLCGEVKISGNKNSALPMIAASLLTEGKMEFSNVPDIIDVRIMLDIALSLGVSVSFQNNILRMQASQIIKTDIPEKLCSRVRASILFVGPLLVKCGSAKFANPGGDNIGKRRLDAHFYGLKCLGAKFAEPSDSKHYRIKAGKLSGRELFFDEASVTATEHIMTTAVLASGRTVIRNAASEPHVRELGELLIKMGAKISGLGTNTITIDGVKKLKGTQWAIRGDHVEAGSFLSLAAANGGEIAIKGISSYTDFWMTRRVFEKFNIRMEMENGHIKIPGGQKMRIKNDYAGTMPIISDGPWPQYPTDMMSSTIVMATQAKGSVLFFEKMFEARMFFVDKLIAMGANAVVCDPHRVLITGRSPLVGIEMSSPDIRAGMAMVTAALCAKGRSVIRKADTIMRGYENIIEKLQSLGAKIKIIVR
jgi:UDP-N-acetylglucosamine 1-carboxyvinyltransferase